jgi:hypothetical protein
MDLLESLKATYSILGQEITDLGLELLAHDLAAYPTDQVQLALGRCRKELKRLTLTDILDRLAGQHPGVEEAWSIVSSSMRDESITVVWTDEMRFAFGLAHALADDPVAARMAFKEQYTQLVREARALGQGPNWSVSLGSDKAGRELAILEGVKHGRLLPAYAATLLPSATLSTEEATALLEQQFPRLLA